MGEEESGGTEPEDQERAGEEDKAEEMNWRIKRRNDREAQEEYFENHPYCQVCLAEGRGKRPADDVHEILYRSQGGKCVPDNMISVCRPDHDRAHFLRKPYLGANLRKEDLLRIKEGEVAGVVSI